MEGPVAPQKATGQLSRNRVIITGLVSTRHLTMEALQSAPHIAQEELLMSCRYDQTVKELGLSPVEQES